MPSDELHSDDSDADGSAKLDMDALCPSEATNGPDKATNDATVTSKKKKRRKAKKRGGIKSLPIKGNQDWLTS